MCCIKLHTIKSYELHFLQSFTPQNDSATGGDVVINQSEYV